MSIRVGINGFGRMGRRVGEAPVDHPLRAREGGAGFARVIADGDHVVKLLSDEFFQVLGAMARQYLE